MTDPLLTRKYREPSPKFNSKKTQERFCDIGETETSSPANSCADSTAIADWYEKIVRPIIPPEALKKGRHASHVLHQRTI